VDFTSGYATVTVETVATGILTPGFHGLNIHAVGKCEANSVAAGGGQSADFASAGDCLQAPGHTGQPASGDLPPLLMRSNGATPSSTSTTSRTTPPQAPWQRRRRPTTTVPPGNMAAGGG
jgi:Cu-Zn family superoxide dismutase